MERINLALILKDQSSFTGLYTLILSNIRNKKINFAEIGVEKIHQLKCGRFFPKAKIFAFDNDNKKLVLAKKKKVYQTYYNKMDVKNSKDIKAKLEKIKVNLTSWLMIAHMNLKTRLEL